MWKAENQKASERPNERKYKDIPIDPLALKKPPKLKKNLQMGHEFIFQNSSDTLDALSFGSHWSEWS